MIMSEEKPIESSDDPQPNWVKINALFDSIDERLDNAFMKDEMSFLEVEMTLLMIKEKLFEEKLRLYYLAGVHESNGTQEAKPKPQPPEDFYR